MKLLPSIQTMELALEAALHKRQYRGLNPAERADQMERAETIIRLLDKAKIKRMVAA